MFRGQVVKRKEWVWPVEPEMDSSVDSPPRRRSVLRLTWCSPNAVSQKKVKIQILLEIPKFLHVGMIIFLSYFTFYVKETYRDFQSAVHSPDDHNSRTRPGKGQEPRTPFWCPAWCQGHRFLSFHLLPLRVCYTLGWNKSSTQIRDAGVPGSIVTTAKRMPKLIIFF